LRWGFHAPPAFFALAVLQSLNPKQVGSVGHFDQVLQDCKSRRCKTARAKKASGFARHTTETLPNRLVVLGILIALSALQYTLAISRRQSLITIILDQNKSKVHKSKP
jgi:hypothetical protein